jgi:DNA-binding MarR family transcriptional regulator
LWNYLYRKYIPRNNNHEGIVKPHEPQSCTTKQEAEKQMTRFTDLFTALVRVEISLWNGLDAHLISTAGITLAQFQALEAIRSNSGEARVQDISQQMSITVGATSKVVDRLERDGLAQRSAHPTDRRSSIVSLTEPGASALKVAEDAAENHLRDTLGATLKEDDADRLLIALTAIRTHSGSEVTR